MANNEGPKGLGNGLGGALVKTGGTGGLVAPRGLGLGRPISAADRGLVQSAAHRDASRDAQLVAAQAARVPTPEQIEEINRQVQDELRAKVSAKAAIAIDFTASTTGQIQQLICHAERLAEGLRASHPAGVQILPTAFRGDYSTGSPNFANFGPINDLAWFREQPNESNSRLAPPHCCWAASGFGIRIFSW